jgi:hypothetical protein
MDFVALIIFLVIHYLRPQEWSETINSLRPVQVLACISVFAIIQRRQSVRLKDLWSAPQDYMVTAYFAWTVFASPSPLRTFSAIFPLVFFYFLGVLILNTLPRIRTLLNFWAFSIVCISALAIASTAGFDPFEGAPITNGHMKGRLILNLSIFNNPNALAHAIVPVIPMLYYLLFWRKLFSKALIVVAAIPLTCIYMTLSKGAFVCAAVIIYVMLTFGRPRTVQITMTVLAFVFGTTLLYSLPRMTELNTSKTDEAIQGRVAAFRFGLEQMNRLRFGHGLGNFSDEFYRRGPMRKVKRMGYTNHHLVVRYVWEHYYKAPHSAFVQNGADLGYMGLFLFVGILYTCGRTLILAKVANDEEELIRRVLFAVLVSFAVSSWMVDFCYRATFFFIAAATSAFHRHLRGQFALPAARGAPDTMDEDAPRLITVKRERSPAGSLLPVGAPTIEIHPVSVATLSEAPARGRTEVDVEPAPTPSRGSISWERLRLADIAVTYLLTQLAVQFWIYLIRTM